MALSDEEIVALDRARYRRRWVAFCLVMLFSLGCGWAFALVQAREHWALPPVLDRYPILLAILFGAVVGLALLPLAQMLRTPREALAPRIQGKLIEDHERRGRVALVLTPIVMAIQCAASLALVRDWHGATGRDLEYWIGPVAFTLTALIAAIAISRGKGRAADDELSRMLRARAMRLGFFLAVPGLGAAYLAELYRPGSSAEVLPVVLAACVALPALFLLILDWRAGREH